MIIYASYFLAGHLGKWTRKNGWGQEHKKRIDNNLIWWKFSSFISNFICTRIIWNVLVVVVLCTRTPMNEANRHPNDKSTKFTTIKWISPLNICFFPYLSVQLVLFIGCILMVEEKIYRMAKVFHFKVVILWEIWLLEDKFKNSKITSLLCCFMAFCLIMTIFCRMVLWLTVSKALNVISYVIY